MAEAALKFFLQRLNSLSLQEGEVISPLEDQIHQIEIKLKAIRPFLEAAVGKKEAAAAAALQSWATQLRDAVHDADNCIDEYIIRMNCEGGSDQSPTIVQFRSELGKIETRLTEILRGIARTVALENFKSNYRSLPYYLKSCLMYCCIFPENSWIARGRLVRMLVAEGLVEEIQGENVLDVAKKYMEELNRTGMLQSNEENTDQGRKYKIDVQFREFLLGAMEEENFVSVCRNPDTNIPPNARRVSIHGDDKNLPPDLNYLSIRSLIMFGVSRLSGPTWDCLKAALCNLKLLRVLDLEGVKIESLPDEIGDLMHLRYLGLKNSDISEFPESLSNLQNLQTLDIRQCGRLTALPDSVLNLIRLRHLKMFKNPGVSGTKIPKGIGKLNSIQTLIGIYAGGGISEELSSMTEMRKLGAMDVAADHSAELYAAIMNMGCLKSLKLESKHCYPDWPILPTDGLAPTSHLQKLRLEGPLERLPGFFLAMENLTKLRLGFSHLSENPGSVLKMLPNLKKLCLWRAYDGRQMGREFCGAGQFPKLEYLTISSHLLEEWTEIEEGAFPCLKSLRLHNCLSLRMLPEGLQHVTTLQELYLMPLLDEHEQRLRPAGGEENYKIQHIPKITFITTAAVQRRFSLAAQDGSCPAPSGP